MKEYSITDDYSENFGSAIRSIFLIGNMAPIAAIIIHLFVFGLLMFATPRDCGNSGGFQTCQVPARDQYGLKETNPTKIHYVVGHTKPYWFYESIWLSFLLGIYLLKRQSRVKKWDAFRNRLFTVAGKRDLSFITFSLSTKKPAGFSIDFDGKITLGDGETIKQYNLSQVRGVYSESPGHESTSVYGFSTSLAGAGAIAGMQVSAAQANWQSMTQARAGQRLSISVADLDMPEWNFWCGEELRPRYQEAFRQLNDRN
jgi:hypothetical protein